MVMKFLSVLFYLLSLFLRTIGYLLALLFGFIFGHGKVEHEEKGSKKCCSSFLFKLFGCLVALAGTAALIQTMVKRIHGDDDDDDDDDEDDDEDDEDEADEEANEDAEAEAATDANECEAVEQAENGSAEEDQEQDDQKIKHVHQTGCFNFFWQSGKKHKKSACKG